ncbi:MAG: MutS-related protein, partial [Verrucomicrobiales bacterium]
MLDTYHQRAARFQSEIEVAEARSLQASNRRTGVFLAAIACVIIARYAPIPPAASTILYALGPILLIVFIGLIFGHRRISDALDRAKHLKQLNLDAAARLGRDWEHFPTPPTPVEFRDHSTAKDLDLFGPASLFQLVNTAITPGGRERLADWLSNPTDPETAAARQPAVHELAPMLDWRQELHLAGHALQDRDESKNAMPVRDDSATWISGSPLLLAAARLLPAAFTLLALGQLGGVVAKPWWIFPLILMFGLNKIFGKRIEHTLGDIRREESALQAYTAVFAKLEELTPQSEWLKHRHDQIEGAHEAVEQLCNYATSNAARGSIVYPLLKYGLMWDFHVARGVEQWHQRHAANVEGWFDALAQIEAAASLANLHHDEPSWVFPDFSPDKTVIGKQLGHPLINATSRVANDLTVDPPGQFLLVTGSNMSGKSTLLRSLGLNLTLAQAGAPCCASSLQLPPLSIVTSLRVEDSLTEGVSFFMAELKRIKAAVQLADDPPAGRTILYLFDEILRGTNSVERQAIVQQLLGHLLQRDAIGAITTHDLALAEIESLKSAAKAVHFRESFKDTPD